MQRISDCGVFTLKGDIYKTTPTPKALGILKEAQDEL